MLILIILVILGCLMLGVVVGVLIELAKALYYVALGFANWNIIGLIVSRFIK